MSINDFNALVSDLERLVHELQTNVDFSFEFNNYESDPAVEIKDGDFILFMVESVMNGLTPLQEDIGRYLEDEWYNRSDNSKKEGV